MPLACMPNELKIFNLDKQETNQQVQRGDTTSARLRAEENAEEAAARHQRNSLGIPVLRMLGKPRQDVLRTTMSISSTDDEAATTQRGD